MRTDPKTLGKAMYVASTEDKQWLQNEQRKLYLRSWTDTSYTFRKLWGLITDLRNLRCAFARVAQNRGRKTAGVDGVTIRKVIAIGVSGFLEDIRGKLRSGAFRPSPSRRIMIPKTGKPGEFRPLGIPTVKDRVVQAAMKNIMEPIFEADFYPISYGFRPGRGAHGALEYLRILLMPQPLSQPRPDRRCAYQVAIEGDIKACFDNINHHGLMNRIRQRVMDPKLNRLVVAFLKAGVLSEGQFLLTKAGSPQGGILSPLLANIALSVIEERYERHAWPRREPSSLSDKTKIKNRAHRARQLDRARGETVIVPVRYADDFILLLSVPDGPDRKGRAIHEANLEKEKLARMLKDTLGLELSESKTLITPVTESLRFLGHHVRLQYHRYYGWLSNATIPKHRTQRLREEIRRLFDNSTLEQPLEERLRILNRKLRGWGRYYRFARGAKRVFASLDNYVWHTIKRWLRKKCPHTSIATLRARYGVKRPGRKSTRWREGSQQLFALSRLTVERFKLAWMRSPSFAETSTESPVRNERRTPGSEEGALETAG